MLEETYVSFETAKLLKDKGFDEPCLMCYTYDKKLGNYGHYNSYKNSDVFSLTAPTQQMAMAWLREVHSIDISIIPLRSHKEYLPRIESDTISHDAIPCREYEEACEVAIKYCLENLI